MNILNRTNRRLNACQKFRPGPMRFGVSLPSEDKLFLEMHLSIDTMILDGEAVLRIVDTATRFFCRHIFG